MRDRMAFPIVRLALPLALLLCAASAPAFASQNDATAAKQTPGPPGPPDGVTLLLHKLELLLQQNNRDDFPALLSTSDITGEEAEQATDDLFSYETTRAVVAERDRTQLESALPGDGHHVIVEILTETAARARVLTARFDVRRPRDGDVNSWRIVAITRLTFVQGLYRLRLDTTTQYVAREFTVRSLDVQFTLHSGYVFQAISGEGVTGLVLLGRGEMQFAPTPPTEKGQLRIFSGSETLTALFGAAFIRMHPADFETRIDVVRSSARRTSSPSKRRSRSTSTCAISAARRGTSCRSPATSLPRSAPTSSARSPTRAAAATPKTSRCSIAPASVRSRSTRRRRRSPFAAAPTTKTTSAPTTSSTTTWTRSSIRIASSSKAART